MINYKETQYGFEYGSAKVERLFSDAKKESVVIGVETPKAYINVYVTKTGKIGITQMNKKTKQVVIMGEKKND